MPVGCQSRSVSGGFERSTAVNRHLLSGPDRPPLPASTSGIRLIQRRGRDSNPRTGVTGQRFSRPGAVTVDSAWISGFWPLRGSWVPVCGPVPGVLRQRRTDRPVQPGPGRPTPERTSRLLRPGPAGSGDPTLARRSQTRRHSTSPIALVPVALTGCYLPRRGRSCRCRRQKASPWRWVQEEESDALPSFAGNPRNVGCCLRR